MKIGLEFEGVIRSRQTGEIARWSKMSDQTKRRIKNIMFPRMEAPDPCDRYDALAEVRTKPIENPTSKDLIWALFSEMEKASNAFTNNGYDIQWWEQPIPEKLHEEIKYDFTLADPDAKAEKYTQTIKDNRPIQYRSEGNLFRGGGLHINISSIPHIFADGFVLGLHNRLIHCREYEFQSHYRTNLLYRTRFDAGDKNYNEPIVEYMSHGFNIHTLKDWRKEFVSGQRPIEDRNGQVIGWQNGHRPHLGWASALMYYLTGFVNSAKHLK